MTLFLAAYPVRAASPTSGTISEGNLQVTWTGDFVTPTGGGCGGPNNANCDYFSLNVIPPSYPFVVDIKLQPQSNGDWDLEVYRPDGQLVPNGTSAHNAGVLEEVLLQNPAAGTYRIAAVPFLPAPVSPSYTASATIQQASGGSGNEPITYVNEQPPSPLGRSGGEPSGGVNFKTDKVFAIANTETLRINLDDCSSPARATWDDVSYVLTDQTTADPILFTDSQTGRTFVSQLAGETSLTAFTDNDGGSWTASQGSGIPSGVDHQTVGGGPFHAPLTRDPNGTQYPNAVYYCSQAVATAFCARSDDGGMTFNNGVPLYSAADCGGLHGAVKVAPNDGTVYVPNRSCSPEQAVVVNESNGDPPWVVRRIPGSHAGGYHPAVAIASDGTVYFGYGEGDVDGDGTPDAHPKVAVSHDRGQTWVNITDVGVQLNIQNTAFPAIIAGDPDRAAFAFLGTTTRGACSGGTNAGRACSGSADCAGGTCTPSNPGAPNVNWPSALDPAVWHLYVAHTYDGGHTWTLVDATPNDPVQRGGICNQGTTCSSARNLLDFNDADVDRQGRVIVTYADGCGGSCLNGPPNSGTQLLTIARQVSGRRLFAQYDGTNVPAAPLAEGMRDASAPSLVHITWSTPDDHGSPITAYRVYRRVGGGAFALLTATPATRHALDDTIDPALAYFYRVTAVNAAGEGPFCGVIAIGALPLADPCIVPGLPVLSDQPGDSAPPGTSQQDILLLSAAGVLADGPPRISFTMKVDNLNSPPANAAWRILWKSPNNQTYFAGMNTFNPASGVDFEYGTVNGSSFTRLGAADGGVFSAGGTISITMLASRIGNPQPGDTLKSMSGRTEIIAAGGSVATIDTASSSPPASFTAASCVTGKPDAVDDVVTTEIDTPVVTSVLTNDSDPNGDPIAVLSVTQPANGTALNNGDGSVRYTPASGFHGLDTFTYTISDDHGLIDTAVVTVVVGRCEADPSFAGLGSVTAPLLTDCALDLAWSPGVPVCPGALLRYNVYRSTDPGFTPSQANVIALRVNGVGYRDTNGLIGGTTYYYIVRAEDSTMGNGGPGSDGNEETNLVRVSGVPGGPLGPRPDFLDDIEPAAEAGYAVTTTRSVGAWSVMTDATAHSASHSWVVPDDQPGVPTLTARNDTLALPPLNLTSSSVMSFWHNFDFARFNEIPPPQPRPARYQSGGILEISRDGIDWRDLGADAGGNPLPYILSPHQYNGNIDVGATNPLNGRRAWIGSSDGDSSPGRNDSMQQVTVNLGQAIQDFYGATLLPGARVRFRMGGTFQILAGGVQGTGWGVDDISVSGLLAPGPCGTLPAPASGAVPEGTLRISKASAGAITLNWAPSCSSTDTDYEIYEGTLGGFYSHASLFCSTGGATTKTLTPASGSAYYLVVPRNSGREGSYGERSSGAERPQGSPACVQQSIGACMP